LIARSDFLFGNEDEFAHLARVMDIDHAVDTEDPQCYVKLCKQLHKRYHAKKVTPAVVVVTRGSKSVIVSDSLAKDPTEVKVPTVDPSLIKDTNGAGDSFVGGFLSQIVIGNAVERGVKAGMQCSRVVLQQVGCSFPKNDPLPDPFNI